MVPPVTTGCHQKSPQQKSSKRFTFVMVLMTFLYQCTVQRLNEDWTQVVAVWVTLRQLRGHRTGRGAGSTDLTRLSIMVSMLACPRCSELPSVWLSNRFFMMAMVCSTNCVLVSLIGTLKQENHRVHFRKKQSWGSIPYTQKLCLPTQGIWL